MMDPTIPISADKIRTRRLPDCIAVPVKAAANIRVRVEEEPMILSLIVASLPSQPNLAFSAGVIWFV